VLLTLHLVSTLPDIFATFSHTSDTDHIANTNWLNELTNCAAKFEVTKDDLIASMCNTTHNKQPSHERMDADHHTNPDPIIWQQSRKNRINNSFSDVWLSALPRKGTTFMTNE
jgi:hypothetical protein